MSNKLQTSYTTNRHEEQAQMKGLLLCHLMLRVSEQTNKRLNTLQTLHPTNSQGVQWSPAQKKTMFTSADRGSSAEP